MAWFVDSNEPNKRDRQTSPTTAPLEARCANQQIVKSVSQKTSVLSAKHIVAGYTSRPSLNGISLETHRGAGAIGITGASGVGKSTLINALAGDMKLSSGRVTYDGVAVNRLALGNKKRFKTAVRKVAQNGFTGFDSRMKVGQIVAGELKLARKAGRGSGESIAEILDLMGLGNHFEDRVLHSLSGGERQRLSIAVALSTRPDVLLLDEPTTALDATLKDVVSRRLLELTHEREIGVVVVSHDFALLSRLTPTVHVLADGQFVETGSARALLTNPQHPATKDLADAYPESVAVLRKAD